MKALNAIRMGGVDILPLVEGGKGVAVTDGVTCGHWAASGGVGTFSAVNADSYDAEGHRIAQVYHGRTRRDRHEELVDYAIKGGIWPRRSRPTRSTTAKAASTPISCGRWAERSGSSQACWKEPAGSSTG